MKKRPTTILMTGLFVFFIAIGANSCSPKNEGKGEPVIPTKDFLTDRMAKTPFEKEWIFREDLPVDSDLESGGIFADVFQNEKQLRIVFNMADNSVSGSKKVNCTLSFNPMYFFVMGTPVLVDPGIEKKRDIDYVFKNERLYFNVNAEDHLQYIEFTVASRKLKNLGNLTVEDKIKQARMIRWIRQKLESWSPLASGQIIAQPTLRPIISHGGYAVDGTKKAVIWANNTNLTGEFELLDALKNRQHPDVQPVVYTGELKETGNHIWGGNNYIADFSDFTKEGLYFIRVKVNETNEVTDSYVFPVRKNLYLDLAVKASRWFNYQRCGTEVPGFHKECHTEDIIIKLDGTKVDVSGGWHDAGDYGKWIGAGTTGVMALTILHDEFGNEFGSGSDIPEFVDEAAWEADYFCRSYWDGIFHAGFDGNFENVVDWLGPPENEPQRVVMEVEMLENKYGYTEAPGISFTGAYLAKAGSQAFPYDKKFAERSISVAKEVYEIDYNVKLEENRLNSFLGLQAGLLLSDVELYKITKEEKYKKDADIRVKNILRLQVDGKEGFFYPDEAKKSESREGCRFQMLALHEFYKLYPESELAEEIKITFKRWADYMMQYADVSNFGLIGGEAEDGSVRNYVFDYSNRKIGAVAWGLATAAILLDESKYLEAAEHQIQWLVGFNAADISMMAGVGRGPGCYHHRYAFMEGCEDGVVPGGILNGIVGGKGKVLDLGDFTKNFIVAEVPIDYPVIDTDVWGFTFAYLSNEYWTRNNSWFILGALQIERALRFLEGTDPKIGG
ncbi:MAG: glycoside hydrolase family 9 protein [Bacteroidales bacterium]|nr:glycoside hydrolase family 9 protein [Bacteroidales bacterium]